ncbi:MAG: hypothetical protein OCD02_03630 [Spirochaetaceae bacterium]
MKSIKILCVCLFFNVMLSTSATEIEVLRTQYKAEELREYISGEKWEDRVEKADLLYSYFWVLQQTSAPQSKIENIISLAIPEIKALANEGINPAVNYYRLAKLYEARIIDLATLLSNSKEKEKYFKLSVELDPKSIDTRILEVFSLIFFPEVAGGNEKVGLKKLMELESEYPNNPDVLYLMGDYYFMKEDHVKAKDYYVRVIQLNPYHYQANENYKEITIVNEGLKIGEISIDDNLKTKITKTYALVKELEGEIYNFEIKQKIIDLIEKMPSINSVQIESSKTDDLVNLKLTLNEDNTKVHAFLGNIRGTNTNSDDINYSGAPLYLFSDSNFLGTGNEFILITAGIFLGIDYTIKENLSLPFNFKLHADSLFISNPYTFIENGVETDWGVTTPMTNISLSIIKTSDFGVTLSTNHNISITDFEGSTDGFITPENNYTYTGDMEFSLTTKESSLPGAFGSTVGFSFLSNSSIIYKPNFESWGYSENLYTHDESPAGKFKNVLSYDFKPVDRSFISLSIGHYAGINLYESEKWEIGASDLLGEGPRLSGYLESEYRSDNAVILNLDFNYDILSDTFLVFVKHDIFLDVVDTNFYHGSGLGIALMLPFDIELGIEADLSWNAVRESNPGWSANITVSKYIFK